MQCICVLYDLPVEHDIKPKTKCYDEEGIPGEEQDEALQHLNKYIYTGMWYVHMYVVTSVRPSGHPTSVRPSGPPTSVRPSGPPTHVKFLVF